MKWKTKDGRELNPKDMETSHIQNAVAMLRRKGFVAPSDVELFLFGPALMVSLHKWLGSKKWTLFFQRQ